MSDAARARALVLEAPRRLTTRSFPRPEIGDDDALLRVEACGLCGTDHEEYTGELFPGYAFVPGHESVGILEQVGPTAAAALGRSCRRPRRGRGVPVVRRVRAPAARACTAVASGTASRDMYGFVPVDRAARTVGRLRGVPVPRARLAARSRRPDLDPVTATLFNPLGAGIRWAVTVPEHAAG